MEIVIGWAWAPWDPNLCPGDRDYILRIVQAIDGSGKGYIALDRVSHKEG
jgi:hypothetical protein